MGKIIFRAAGKAASPDMPAGERVVLCQAYSEKEMGGKWVLRLRHKICEGSHYDGQILSQWLSLKNDDGPIEPKTKYFKQVQIALGRPVRDDEDLSPGVFIAKTFLVFAGYSKSDGTEKITNNNDNAMRKKGDDDYIRVHEILKLLPRDEKRKG